MFNFNDLEILKVLGEGSFGKVYLARFHETAVAVKVLLDVSEDGAAQGGLVQSLSSPALGKLSEEAALMAKMRHPNIVAFMGICTSPPSIASEYCRRGSLYQVLQAAKSSSAAAAQLMWSRRLNMILDAAKGMLHLHVHSPPIIHRDLKSPNLLVGTSWECKVSDFNLSKLMEQAALATNTSSIGAFNPRWLAPELLENARATPQSDVFSYGVVMWEVLTWQMPWAEENVWAIARKIGDGSRLKVPPADKLPGMPPGGIVPGMEMYIALMQRCWSQDPASRPDFQQVIQKLREIMMVCSKVGR